MGALTVNTNMSKRILDELEAVYVRIRKIKVEGVAVIKFRVNNEQQTYTYVYVCVQSAAVYSTCLTLVYLGGGRTMPQNNFSRLSEL